MASFEFNLLQIIWQAINQTGLSESVAEICMEGMAKSTKQQYESHLQHLRDFCKVNGKEFMPIKLETALDFLKKLFDEGKSYSTINSARSAISQTLRIANLPNNQKLGDHPVVHRFMTGIYRLRPPKPKYEATWDVKPLLDLLRLTPTDSTNLQMLSSKLVCLIALTTSQRTQTMAALDLKWLQWSTDMAVFHVQEVLKTSKPGKPVTVCINAYNADLTICPLNALKVYIKATAKFRDNDKSKLFLGYCNPHFPVGAQTLSRWITFMMRKAGINPGFTSHSIRHAGSSKAASKLPISTVLNRVGWTNEKTFATFYRREATSNTTDSYTDAVLDT